MATITFGGWSDGGYNSTAAKPSGLANGDIWVIWAAGYYDADAVASVTGFSLILETHGDPGFDRLFGTLIGKIITNAAGEPSTVSISVSGGGGDVINHSFYCRGADISSLANAVSDKSFVETGSASSLTLPSTTVTRSGSRAFLGTNAWAFDVWSSGGVPNTVTGFTGNQPNGSEVSSWFSSSDLSPGTIAPTVPMNGGLQDALAGLVVFQPAAPPSGTQVVLPNLYGTMID